MSEQLSEYRAAAAEEQPGTGTETGTGEVSMMDRLAVELYARWSEEYYAASWLNPGPSGELSPHFSPEWLARQLTRPLEDYELAALPLLRQRMDGAALEIARQQ